jgi:soluble lytic murein transglycosylase-like protein
MLLMSCAAGWAQTDAVAAMEASLDQQRSAVEKQRAAVRAQAAGPVSGPVSAAEFFTAPWPKAAVMLSADCDALPKARVDELTASAASRAGVKPDIIREVMHRESAYKPCAISVKGAQGLMQLMPATAEQFGVKDPFDPEQNVAAGAKFLKQLLDRYNGDLSLALAAYNAGPGTVDRAGTVPDNPETKNYVIEILKRIVL